MSIHKTDSNPSPSTVTIEQSKVSVASTPNIVQGGPLASPVRANRKSILIQNHSTSPLNVLFGTGCSATVFHVILKGCTAQDDGSGGAIYNNEYTGAVTVFGSSMRFTVYET